MKIEKMHNISLTVKGIKNNMLGGIFSNIYEKEISYETY